MFYDLIMANKLTGQGPKGTSVEYMTSTKLTKSPYDQTSRTINGRKIHIRVHRLAHLKKMRETNLDKTVEASHLCHNTLCMEVDHIVAEPHKVNQCRIHCAYLRQSEGDYGYCSEHKGYPKCI